MNENASIKKKEHRNWSCRSHKMSAIETVEF